MKTSLLKGIIDEDEKRRIEESFLSSRKFRERLQVLLEEKYESDAINVMTKDGYKDPSWAYRQADHMGYKRAIYELISLLK